MAATIGLNMFSTDHTCNNGECAREKGGEAGDVDVIYLMATYFLNIDNPAIVEFGNTVCSGLQTPREKGVALYYAVRDRIRYDPYDLRYQRDAMRASSILKKGTGYCVSKAVLLCALCRQQGIPSRLGFSDVTNHLSTPKLQEKMGTNLFIYHGYTEMFIEGQWLKVTPAFNLSLCERFGVLPLEFDGTASALFHPFDAAGRKHMEYVRDHGHYHELPFDEIFTAYGKQYPKFFQEFGGIDKVGDLFSEESSAL